MPPNDEIKIDKVKAQRLLKKLIIMERQNLKTRMFNSQQMVKEIKKSIEEEVECFSSR